ncbi:MAG: SDR family oxidoreductase [Anaerolineae bacterium]|nr:SDR family oxidoreductase [Anaerolineae bacterium]
MLLVNKIAVIYGGAGAVGGAIARAFAREGARVFLAGRTRATLESVTAEIRAAGGLAEISVVDADDLAAVEQSLTAILAQTGRIDISVNAVSHDDVQGQTLLEMSHTLFAQPIHKAMLSYFNTTTAAARHMARQGSGVILAISANAALQPAPTIGGFGVACAAIEALCRQLAVEVSPQGVRVACLRSAGSPDAPGLREIFTALAHEQGITFDEFCAQAANAIPLRHLPALTEVANAAVLAVSDYASAMTGAVINVTCGQVLD